MEIYRFKGYQDKRYIEIVAESEDSVLDLAEVLLGDKFDYVLHEYTDRPILISQGLEEW